MTPLITNRTAQGWTSWWNGIHFSGMQNALDGNITWDGSASAYNTNASGHGNGGGWSALYSLDHEPIRGYGWVGLKSLSDAVEIVHIPKGMPKVSDSTTSQQLRVGICLADSYDSNTLPEDVEFILALYDPNTTFTDNATGHSITDGYNSNSTLKFKHSGFHEIAIPSTYWSSQTGNERIVVSINAEYLRSLLRHRNGNPIPGDRDWETTMLEF